MRGKYQQLCSTAASFLDMNAIVFSPLTSTQSCCRVPALLGLEQRQEAWVTGRELWACLQVRAYLLSAVGNPGWKNHSSGVTLMLTVPTWPCPLLWVPTK